MRIAFAAGISALLAFGTAHAADSLRIGYITTTSGPGAVLGRDMLDAFRLGLKHSGGKLGGLPVELFVEDDQVNPSIGVQKATKLVQDNKVHMVVGVVWSHVLLAITRT